MVGVASHALCLIFSLRQAIKSSTALLVEATLCTALLVPPKDLVVMNLPCSDQDIRPKKMKDAQLAATANSPGVQEIGELVVEDLKMYQHICVQSVLAL